MPPRNTFRGAGRGETSAKRYRGAALLAFVASAGAACAPTSPDTVTEIELTVVDTLLRADAPGLGMPSELAIDETGLLYVTDAAASTVHVVDTTGTILRTIGRPGAGPGEFRRPRSLRVARDTVRLIDQGNGRVLTFAPDGRYLGTRPEPPVWVSGGVVLGADGSAVVALNGYDGVLAQRFDAAGNAGNQLGTPVVAAPEVWDFPALKQQIANGEVPAELRNVVHPVLGPNGGVWLLLDAEAAVQHYTARDSLAWSLDLTEPEFAAIRAEFFERNRTDANPNRLWPLSYLVGGRVVGDDLWVLVRQPEAAPTLLLIVDPGGRLRHRVVVAAARGVRGFALDRRHAVLYLLAYQDAVVLRVRVPASLLPVG